MSFSAAFLAICADPFGEPLRPRLWVRLNDGPGPGTLVELTATQVVLSVNPIERRRELSFGVVQAQSWQVQITNIDLALNAYNLKDCWCAIEGGFLAADEWAVFAQGKIKRVITRADRTATLEIHDAVMDLLNFKLPRPIRFQSTGWASGVSTLTKSNASRSWNSTVALTVNNAALLDDETFIIEFTTATAYKVVLEDGSGSQTGTIAANKTINNVAGDSNVLTIPAAGWDATANAYAVGDKFIFHTARARTSDELTPIYMVMHLVADVVGLSVYDVLAGAAYATAWDDDTAWTAAAEDAVSSLHTIEGYWDQGTLVIELIQDALKIVHGSMYPTATGQLGLWVLQPGGAVAVVLNGEPANGAVSILDGAQVDDDLDLAISGAIFRYKALGTGEAASCTVTDTGTDLQAPRVAEVSIGWEVRGLSVLDAAQRYLSRYKGGIKQYTMPATLAGLVADIGNGVAFHETDLGLNAEVSDVTGIALDVMGNRVSIVAHTDPVSTQDNFKLDESLLGGTAVLW